MKRPQLVIQKREVLGKKIKKLRQQGILPGNIYGKDIPSQAVQVPLKEFEAVYKEVGETGLVDLALDGQTRPVLIKNVFKDSLSDKLLHTDFHQVNLKEKIKAMIPVKTVGEPKAVSEKIGLLMQPTAEIEVEALPTDLPEHFDVNVEALAQIGDQIKVKDLKVESGVAILSDPEQVVIKIDELVSKEAEAEAAAEAAAAEAAKAEGTEASAENAAEVKEEAKEEKVARNASASVAGGAAKAEKKPAEAPKEDKKE